MELTKLDAMILNALVDHGPLVEDGSKTKGSEGWRDALHHLNNSSDRLARVPRKVIEDRLMPLYHLGYLEGSSRFLICERLTITDAGREAVQQLVDA